MVLPLYTALLFISWEIPLVPTIPPHYLEDGTLYRLYRPIIWIVEDTLTASTGLLFI